MKEGLIQIGKPREEWNASRTRVLKYAVDIYHEGLMEHKTLSAKDIDMLDDKLDIQIQKWQDRWNFKVSKTEVKKEKEANAEEALIKTDEAKNAIFQIENILFHTLSVDDRIDWDSLKDTEPFPKKMPPEPDGWVPEQYMPKPDPKSPEYNPTFTLIEKVSIFSKKKKEREFSKKYETASKDWEKHKRSVDERNNQQHSRYLDQKDKWKAKIEQWEIRNNAYLEKQSEYNLKIDEMKKAYFEEDLKVVPGYCELVLNKSNYPDTFPKQFDLEYNEDTKILIIEYELPGIDCFPRLKEVKYVSNKNEFKQYYISESKISEMFDEAMYKITLRTIHEIFESDVIDAIEAVSFNGWIKAIDRGTGKEQNNCILSIQVKKDEFLNIDLSKVDPKTCFKELKRCSK